MRILHTSDWHLGKNLEGNQRLPEQEKFLDDFVKIIEENDIDMVLIAGDIYDTSNPPAKAEQLFYRTLKKISNHGQRLILVIAGNHDSPERLVAAGPLAREHGIIMVGMPKSIIPIGEYGQHEVLESGEGYVKLRIHDETAVILMVPFPSERRLNEFIYKEMEEDQEKQKSYSERIKLLFDELSQHFEEDTINLVVSHLFVNGTQEGGSERNISLGGSYLVDSKCFPKQAQYIALGHVHKPQIVPGTNKRARYSGSPIHFNKREIAYEKKVIIVTVHAKEECLVEEKILPVYKPIEVWKCKSFDEALEKCTENSERECWVYLEILTDSYITEEQIKLLREQKKDILEILPVVKGQEDDDYEEFEIKEKSFKQLFQEFFIREKGAEPTEELVDLLMSIVAKEDEDETDLT